MSFSKKILIGLLAGIATGIVLGEYVAPLALVAQGFVRLLQMTVLPYVTVSIVLSLGSLDLAQAKRLGLRAGLTIGGLWVVALIFAFLFPLVFPPAESASFFNQSLVEKPAQFDFVDLYIPSNPFHSLANNIVPAVVLFSIVVGLALIGIPRKTVLLDVLKIVSDTIARATRFIARLTPVGVFALAATAAGTLQVDQIERARGLPNDLCGCRVAGRAVGAARAGRDADHDSVPRRAVSCQECADYRLQRRGSLHRTPGAD
jgi:Na+/H+-dicarboxylate symporter